MAVGPIFSLGVVGWDPVQILESDMRTSGQRNSDPACDQVTDGNPDAVIGLEDIHSLQSLPRHPAHH